MVQNPELLIQKLKDIFGYDDFMSDDQKEAATVVMRGESDVMINLQPGAGKSICFQLPSVLKPRTLSVVFVPTKILGKNHVDFLKRKNIRAEYLCPSTLKKLGDVVRKDLRSNEMELQFLYASTDKRTRDFVNEMLTVLKARNAVSFIVFDEAHCISRSSHDYVSTYREAAESIKLFFPNIRKIAVTGTSTLQVRRDIANELGMTELRKVFSACQRRTFHEVCFVDMLLKPYQNLKDFIIDNIGPSMEQSTDNRRKCGIIFCRKKCAADIIQRELGAMGISVVTYHGGMSSNKRATIERRWFAGEIAVIATTRSFGIGLHGPNVRFVVHWSMPLSIQQLYQEAERSFRNDGNSSCRVYFSIEEEDNIRTHIKSLATIPGHDIDVLTRKYQFFDDFIDYCLQSKCRHVAQMAYFGQWIPPCRLFCDACRDRESLSNRIDQFLNFRSITKEKMVLELAHKRTLQSHAASARVGSNDENRWKNTRIFSPIEQKRQRYYHRLFDDLTINYTVTRAEIEENIKLKDIPEITRELEYSLWMGSSSSKKYTHDVIQVIRNIRKSNEAKSICGYLKYYRSEKISYCSQKSSIVNRIDEDERMEEKIVNINDKSTIDIVDLMDDSDSGSETD